MWENYTGSGCAPFSGAGGLPKTVVDSPVVVQAFMNQGGRAYIAGHPDGSLTYDVLGAYGSDTWWVSYSTCPADGSAPSGVAYNYSQEFFATNGSALAAASTNTTTRCGGLDLVGGILVNTAGVVDLSTVLAASVIANDITAVGANYSFSITLSSGPLVWNDLSFTLVNATGGAIAGAGLDSVVIAGAGGCEIAAGITGIPYYTPPIKSGCSSGTLGGGAGVAAGETVTVSNPEALPPSVSQLSISGAPTFRGSINLTIPAPSTTESTIGSALSLSGISTNTNTLGTAYSATVVSAKSTLIWAEVAFEILNNTGSAAAGPYAVDIASSTGCLIASGSPNSSEYIVPIYGACSSETGRTAPVQSGDIVSVVTSTALEGNGYQWVAEGQNLYDSTVAKLFAGVTSPIEGVLSVGPVSTGNSSTGYSYAVNVTSATGGVELDDVAVGVNVTGWSQVGGQFEVVVYAPSGCELATAPVNSTAYLDPTSDACTSQTLGGHAAIVSGDRLVVLSHVSLVGVSTDGYREELAVTGQASFSGWVGSPLPITGGPLFFVLGGGYLPTSGTDAAGYYYNLTFKTLDGLILAKDLAVTALGSSYGPLAGPYSVNFTAAAGCVLATGGVNVTTYTVPTSNACASGTLGGGAQLVAGDSVLLYSTVDLSGGTNWLALYAFGPYVGNYFFEIT